ncbi:MAG TPA: peptide-methionine (R)-S-oxide reductase MsrB [Kiritimatiellia bacterium]|nr:peptide-methionine (R)-S-oxide reductase MsrB [Kiritimatiellia bacterium]
MLKKMLPIVFLFMGMAVLISQSETKPMSEKNNNTILVYDLKLRALVSDTRWEFTEAEWREKLPPETYQVMRRHGTERPFSCGRLKDMGEGTYTCAACGLALFQSASKFDSGTGWPSFFQPVHTNNIGTTTDYLLGPHYPRTEVHCARCGGHLGHVFDDGPRPTGLRYCMNSVAMKFIPAE